MSSKLDIQEIIERLNQKEQNQSWLKEIQFESVKQPTVFLSLSSATPANIFSEIRSEVERYAKSQNLNILIVETGSLGIFSFEPVFAVQLPGKARLYYAEVYAEDVFSLLDAVFSSWAKHGKLLGQMIFVGTESWEGVPNIKDQSWYCNESRFVTEACGLYDPNDLQAALTWNRWVTFIQTIRNYSREDVLSFLQQSELKGRSGSGFYTARKWKSVLQTNSEQHYLICNAYESNPSSFNSRLLLESDTHSVLESIAISAYTLNCNKAYLVVPYYFTTAIQRIKKALEDAHSNELLGYDILKSGFSLDIILFVAPGSYIMGEETAIINAIEGKKAMPNEKPPYPIQQGLWGKPTAINNIETLIQVTYILRYGITWFKSQGNDQGFGTKLFSVSGKNMLRGVFEFPLGTQISKIFVTSKKEDVSVKAIHMGGPIGKIFNEKALSSLKCTFPRENQPDIYIGDGSVLFLDNSNCLLDYIKNEMQFISKESCGKCLPCREGSKHIYHILDLLTRRPENDQNKETLERIKEVMQLTEVSETISQTSLCGLGKNFPLLIQDLLQYFKEEVEEHLYERHCKAGVCSHLKLYVIDVDKCTGCHVCYNKCPENAIVGVVQHPHFIVQDKCVSCGICFNVCKFSAISFK